MKKSKLIILALLTVMLLLGAYKLYNILMDKYAPEILAGQMETMEGTENDAAAPGITPAPRAVAGDITVYNAEGNAVSLSDFAGKPVVINFWATWCGPCKNELPWFDKLHTRYGDDVVFMMVNLTDGYRDTVDGVKKFVADNDYGFPVYFDTENSAGISYNVSSIPVTVFVDTDGTIIRTVTGMINETLLTNTVIKMAGDD